MEYNKKSQTSIRRQLRNNMTMHECILWRALKGNKIHGLRFRRQFGVGSYILDFYCPSIKLCIELDGDVHNDVLSSEYDSVRNKFLNDNGIYVLRFENRLLFDDNDNVLNAIMNISSKLLSNELQVATRIVTKYTDDVYTYTNG